MSFVRDIRAANVSTKTIEIHADACQQLTAFLRGRGMPTDAGSIRREHVETFIESPLERW